MTLQLPAPVDVRTTFSNLFESDPQKAIDYLYSLGVSSGYIKTEAVAKNIHWTSETPYAVMEFSVNLTKPEKDPELIAAAAAQVREKDLPDGTSSFPHCELCWENEGFVGTPDFPAKPGLRIAAITLGNERWGLQFSPYAYFAEHCIALSQEHRPMNIDTACFIRLLDFVEAFPFYFVGSNADLPIVGGSILSHDHFQGGRHTFPLMKAALEREIPLVGLPQVHCGIVNWPASTLRLVSDNREALVRGATRILDVWKGYSDDRCNLAAFSAENGEGVRTAHNTLTVIARMSGSEYTLELVLRNNRTDSQHPWGIFHPGEPFHHIKKENIGLIEIMGLAILPPRLAQEIPSVQAELGNAARQGLSPHLLRGLLEGQVLTAPHADWATEIYTRRSAEFIDTFTLNSGFHPVIEQEIARVFVSILETTGVFKRTEEKPTGWNSFIEALDRAGLET